MRTLVHLSDIHFGRTDEKVVAGLIEAIEAVQPDLVAVSGDLTQRARTEEFQRAREFLDALPRPQIVIPGNHDVPLHNIYARFTGGLDKYRRYISDDLDPWWSDDELAVAGVNTARSLTFKGGRISHGQIRHAEERLCAVRHETIKVVVTHHPFDLPDPYSEKHLVGRAHKAMSRFARCGVDLFLAGHFHVSYCGRTAERYELGSYSAIFVQAGTACSTRGRGEPNSFNVIQTEPGSISVKRFAVDRGGMFRAGFRDKFRCSEQGWQRIAADA